MFANHCNNVCAITKAPYRLNSQSLILIVSIAYKTYKTCNALVSHRVYTMVQALNGCLMSTHNVVIRLGTKKQTWLIGQDSLISTLRRRLGFDTIKRCIESYILPFTSRVPIFTFGVSCCSLVLFSTQYSAFICLSACLISVTFDYIYIRHASEILGQICMYPSSILNTKRDISSMPKQCVEQGKLRNTCCKT